jgi:hypothetical protein
MRFAVWLCTCGLHARTLRHAEGPEDRQRTCLAQVCAAVINAPCCALITPIIHIADDTTAAPPQQLPAEQCVLMLCAPSAMEFSVSLVESSVVNVSVPGQSGVLCIGGRTKVGKYICRR